MPKILHDPVGERYHNLTIIKSLGIHGIKSVRWVLAKCDCGQTKEVRYGNLKYYGSPRDCGCGIGSKNRHGLTKDPLHNLWLQMKNRCYNPNHKSYKDYGAQGVTVDPRWMDDFKQFYHWAQESGYQSGLQLDRIDTAGDYSPDNCRWVTQEENLRTRRNSMRINAFGKEMTLTEWSRELNVSYAKLRRRFKEGIRGEDIFNNL